MNEKNFIEIRQGLKWLWIIWLIIIVLFCDSLKAFDYYLYNDKESEINLTL